MLRPSSLPLRSSVITIAMLASESKEGIAMKAADLLSLGGFLPPAPVQAATTITVRYLGLPGDPAVTAYFD